MRKILACAMLSAMAAGAYAQTTNLAINNADGTGVAEVFTITELDGATGATFQNVAQADGLDRRHPHRTGQLLGRDHRRRQGDRQRGRQDRHHQHRMPCKPANGRN